MVQVGETTGSMPLEKIPKPSKQQVLDWVVKAWRELQKRQKCIVIHLKFVRFPVAWMAARTS